ncbi:MAG: aminotransferase class IV [Sediminibacterium sp.]
MSHLICFLNNRFVPMAEASVPLNDLGLHRGYGIFDFLRVTDNVPLFWDDHLNRFYRSANLMRLTPSQSREDIKLIITQLIEKNALPHSGIKLLLTGGASPDGYQIGEPNLMIFQQAILRPPETIFLPGFRLVTYPHQRQLPEVKTTDYIMAVLLQPWIKENEADDMLYHQNGVVSECPRSNFFIVTQNDTLVTPDKNILHGITRKQLLAIAFNIGIAVEERDVLLQDIRQAKEAFITSSTKRLIPVTQIDDHSFPVFSKNSVTERLYNAFKERELATVHEYKYGTGSFH